MTGIYDVGARTAALTRPRTTDLVHLAPARVGQVLHATRTCMLHTLQNPQNRTGIRAARLGHPRRKGNNPTPTNACRPPGACTDAGTLELCVPGREATRAGNVSVLTSLPKGSEQPRCRPPPPRAPPPTAELPSWKLTALSVLSGNSPVVVALSIPGDQKQQPSPTVRARRFAGEKKCKNTHDHHTHGNVVFFSSE